MRTEQQIRAELDQAESTRRRLRKELRKSKGLPAKKKGTFVRDGHEYLEGSKFERRLDIYRNAGGDLAVFENEIEDLKPGMCQGCAETHEVGWFEGEWHHNVKTLGGRRCDCAACGLWVCEPWHKRYHNRTVRSGKVGA